jgi:uncharacterized membrane protein
VLIFFIHHIVLGLQAANIVAAIARDALPSIDLHFPDRFEPPEQETVDLRRPEGNRRAHVHASRSGYVTGIDLDALIDRAEAGDGWVLVRSRPGMFVAEGEVLAELRTPEPVDEQRVQALAGAWSFATQRTLENDPGYGLRQLVDVALKALSPGVNETTTGVMCVNWLGVMLLRMAGRRFPAQIRTRDQCIRVITNAPRLGGFIDLAFNQIRQNAAGNVAVLLRQLEVLLALAESDGGQLLRHPILRQADAIEAQMQRSIYWEPDREPLLERLGRLREHYGVEAKSADAARDS